MKIDFKDPNNWIPRELFAAYCGEKNEGLLSFYDKSIEKGKMNCLSLNWLAILFVPAWCGYRRQWKILIFITVFASIIPFIEILFSFELPDPSKILIPVLFGLLANSILLDNAQKKFMKLKKIGLDGNEIKQQLENKATPSVLYAVLAGLGSFIIIGLSNIFIHNIFNIPL